MNANSGKRNDKTLRPRRTQQELEEAETELDDEDERIPVYVKEAVLEQDQLAKLKQEIEDLQRKVIARSKDKEYTAYGDAMTALKNKKQELKKLEESHIAAANKNKSKSNNKCLPCQGKRLDTNACKKLAACHVFGNSYCHLHQNQAKEKMKK